MEIPTATYNKDKTILIGPDKVPLCVCGDAQWKHKHDGACQNIVCPCNSYRPRGGWAYWGFCRKNSTEI